MTSIKMLRWAFRRQKRYEGSCRDFVKVVDAAVEAGVLPPVSFLVGYRRWLEEQNYDSAIDNKKK